LPLPRTRPQYPLHDNTRRLIALLLATVVAAAPAAPALAQDNAAIAVNTKDDSSVFKLAFKISNVMQPVVENQNAAVAYASCTDCRTVAIAIQIVFIAGDADVVSPENVAIAINDGCVACETLAAAYQFVFGTGELMRLTADGRRQINEIRKALRELGRDGDGKEEREGAQQPEATPGSEGTPDASPTPEATTTPAPEPTVTATPSAEPTASATPAATP